MQMVVDVCNRGNDCKTVHPACWATFGQVTNHGPNNMILPQPYDTLRHPFASCCTVQAIRWVWSSIELEQYTRMWLILLCIAHCQITHDPHLVRLRAIARSPGPSSSFSSRLGSSSSSCCGSSSGFAISGSASPSSSSHYAGSSSSYSPNTDSIETSFLKQYFGNTHFKTFFVNTSFVNHISATHSSSTNICPGAISVHPFTIWPHVRPAFRIV